MQQSLPDRRARMTKVLTIGKSAEDGLKELLKFLLENGKVKGVVTLRKTGDDGAISYSLITDAGKVESAVPLFPLMPVNLGKQLSRLTLVEAAADPIAVVLRPCELRAFVELVKRTQGNVDNILFISSTCGGVYPLEMAAKGNLEQHLPEYWKGTEQGELITHVRSACQACEYFVPYAADITISLLNNKGIGKETTLFLNSEKGQGIVEGITGKFAEGELDTAAIEQIRSKRKVEKEKLSDEAELKNLGIDEITKTFSRCIGCRNCSAVCPACYCHVCFFQTETSQHERAYYERELENKGCTTMLSDTIFYHLVRLFHVSISCTACGQCADVCPANIPLWAISLKMGEAVQRTFDYLPGKDIEQGLPITTFVPEEFAGIV
jgi:formate dehydrogenase subunit beta